ncbi:hypothetical protein BDY19DRAFT_963606 [Irpex rosettiformis]|uniref:Uncharacterized protein n=1 Tax=Irpex rosettiformis TaxID=378272 RepID=A0ACB8TV44_9APHY|nr:hypothetical protein BDY19DRAFT_963606 [Irpex rosettiformis]
MLPKNIMHSRSPFLLVDHSVQEAKIFRRLLQVVTVDLSCAHDLGSAVVVPQGLWPESEHYLVCLFTVV